MIVPLPTLKPDSARGSDDEEGGAVISQSTVPYNAKRTTPDHRHAHNTLTADCDKRVKGTRVFLPLSVTAWPPELTNAISDLALKRHVVSPTLTARGTRGHDWSLRGHVGSPKLEWVGSARRVESHS